jgi:hypothetical protein
MSAASSNVQEAEAAAGPVRPLGTQVAFVVEAIPARR